MIKINTHKAIILQVNTVILKNLNQEILNNNNKYICNQIRYKEEEEEFRLDKIWFQNYKA